MCHEGPYTVSNLLRSCRSIDAMSSAGERYRRSKEVLRGKAERCEVSCGDGKYILDWRLNELCVLLGNERSGEDLESTSPIVENTSKSESLRNRRKELRAIEILCMLKGFIKKGKAKRCPCAAKMYVM